MLIHDLETAAGKLSYPKGSGACSTLQHHVFLNFFLGVNEQFQFLDHQFSQEKSVLRKALLNFKQAGEFLKKMVGREGFEPSTIGLKVRSHQA